MNVLEAVARILKLEGVEWISCFPSNNLIEAVAKEGIRTIMFRQERGALMAADGFSRLNNRRSLVLLLHREDLDPRILWEALPKPLAIIFRSCISPGDQR